MRLRGGQALSKKKSDHPGLIFDVTHKESDLDGQILDKDLKSPRAPEHEVTLCLCNSMPCVSLKIIKSPFRKKKVINEI